MISRNVLFVYATTNNLELVTYSQRLYSLFDLCDWPMALRAVCSFIDAGIEDISSISIGPHTETINLHHNKISKLFSDVFPVSLVHLDLSSNFLTSLCGVENLRNLKRLNLSANRLGDVKALKYLR